MGILIVLITAFYGSTSQATIDAQGQATIVVENYHTGDYFLQTVPTDFCLGTATEALAIAITQPVTIKSNYGCGAPESMVLSSQVNAATCAKLTARESFKPDGSINYRNVIVDKDLSQCGDKSKDSKFVHTLDRAILNTFNASGFQVVEIN